MNGKNFTQWGIVLIVLLLPSLIFLSIKMMSASTLNYTYLLLFVILLPCLLCFYKLTITIDNTYISFKFGVGFIKKYYRIANIKSCKPVSYSIFNGWGIRFFPNGTLYNVTGSKAIELQFYDKNTVVQIGTNQPEEISQLLNSLIGGNKISRQISTTGKHLYQWIVVLIIGAIVVSITSIETFRETKVELNKEELIIKGMLESLTIPISEILQVDTVSNPLSISRKIKGLNFAGTLKGKFMQKDGRPIGIYVKKKHKPYILIHMKNNKMPVYLNFRNRQKTIHLYNKLKYMDTNDILLNN